MDHSPPTCKRLPGSIRRLAIALSMVGLVAAGCTQAPAVTSGDAELELGRTIWSQRCATCHAPDGGGGSGPALNNGAANDNFPNIEDQIDLVVRGKNRMPSFATILSEDETRAVVRYTREVLG